MNKNIKNIWYYLIIIILFVFSERLIFLYKDNKENIVINKALELENLSLKNDIKELSNINYDFDYIIGKITFKNLYDSNTYYIDYEGDLNDKLVLNKNGLLGILSNHHLIQTKDLTLSVKINDNYGILKDNQIKIIKGNYNIGDLIYTSGLTSINENLLIGYVKEIKEYELETIIKLDYIKNDCNYVVILK